MIKSFINYACLAITIVLASTTILRAQPPTSIPVREYFPMLTYIFFDSASAALPNRYITFKSPRETVGFTDTSSSGGVLERYYNVLNVIGYRMRIYPKATIMITGDACQRFGGDVLVGFESDEKRVMVQKRGEIIYRYLIDIWEIDSARIKLLPAGPQLRSVGDDRYLRDAEKERVVIRSDSWDIVKPMVAHYHATKSPEGHPFAANITHVDIFTFILFKFDSPQMGALNERIVTAYLVPAIRPGMRIDIVGHTDVVGLSDRNLRLSTQRAGTVATVLRDKVKLGVSRSCTITSGGVGEETPLFDNTLPEGRFFNRCVRVTMTTVDGN